jgi:hypothetical protein
MALTGFFYNPVNAMLATCMAGIKTLQLDKLPTEPIPVCKYPQQVDARRKALEGKIHARLRAQ